MFKLARPLERRLRQQISNALATATRAYHAPMREMNFLLYGVHDFEAHYAKLGKAGAGTACDRETVDMVVEATKTMAEDVLAPLNAGGDRVGSVWKDPHTVISAPGFKDAYKMYSQNGWQALSFPEKYGGQGLPMSLALIQSEMIAAANWTWLMFPGLSKGAINTILAHARADETRQPNNVWTVGGARSRPPFGTCRAPRSGGCGRSVLRSRSEPSPPPSRLSATPTPPRPDPDPTSTPPRPYPDLTPTQPDLILTTPATNNRPTRRRS